MPGWLKLSPCLCNLVTGFSISKIENKTELAKHATQLHDVIVLCMCGVTDKHWLHHGLACYSQEAAVLPGSFEHCTWPLAHSGAVRRQRLLLFRCCRFVTSSLFLPCCCCHFGWSCDFVSWCEDCASALC
jgi:hypothetical protein